MEPVVAYSLTAVLLAMFFVIFFKLLRIVPEQEAWILENFGKYRGTLGPGFHLVIPILQKIAYKQIIKEEVIDVPPQVCITKDKVQVEVDGLLYLRVVDPVKAAYGIDNYRFGTAQLAQTTMRSEIGKIELDNTFSERNIINSAIVKAVDEASDPWGIKVTRYEIRDITPTDTILKAMEQQVRAEREKRAEVLTSEGERDSRINTSRGEREEAINLSKGERKKRINVSEGRAQSIQIIADATAESLQKVADAIKLPKGKQALSMRIADQFIEQLGDILRDAETTVLPHDLAHIRGLLQTVLPGGSVEEKKGGSA